MKGKVDEDLWKIKEMNWYIGQDIVAVVSHPNGLFKKGDLFVIHAISLFPCKCRRVTLDVGIRRSIKMQCDTCGVGKDGIGINTHGVAWCGENRFAPLDSFVNSEEIAELLEETGVIQNEV